LDTDIRGALIVASIQRHWDGIAALCRREQGRSRLRRGAQQQGARHPAPGVGPPRRGVTCDSKSSAALSWRSEQLTFYGSYGAIQFAPVWYDLWRQPSLL